MKIQYFPDTDTLHIEFRATKVAETRDLGISRQSSGVWWSSTAFERARLACGQARG